MSTRGLVIVHTGDGKGKTTAALGLAIRAFGAGLKVCILQFIKGNCKCGELETIKMLDKLSDGKIQLTQCGCGFINTEKVSFEEHKLVAGKAFLQAKQIMLEKSCDLLILDEINYAVKYGLLSKEEMLKLLDSRPQEMHLVFTGREAAKELIEKADLVTEMHLIKHPYEQGVKAQVGIEF